MEERLQKLLAQANITSRRKAEEFIEQGRVTVNGVIAKLGAKADPVKDRVELDGVALRLSPQRLYIALNKPKQVLSTTEPHGDDKRRTVFDIVDIPEHLFTIGRLDADSEGLIVLTNDGELANKLSHPRFAHTKTYKVEVIGLPTAETIEKWQDGVYLEEDGRTAPCIVQIAKGGQRSTILRIIMTEARSAKSVASPKNSDIPSCSSSASRSGC